jgi:hypothetical protein
MVTWCIGLVHHWDAGTSVIWNILNLFSELQGMSEEWRYWLTKLYFIGGWKGSLDLMYEVDGERVH